MLVTLETAILFKMAFALILRNFILCPMLAIVKMYKAFSPHMTCWECPCHSKIFYFLS